MIFASPTISSNQSSMVAFFIHQSSGSRCLQNLSHFQLMKKNYFFKFYFKTLRHRVYANFMSKIPKVLYISIIGILMTDEKCRVNWTTIRIFSISIKKFWKILKRCRTFFWQVKVLMPLLLLWNTPLISDEVLEF